MSSRGYLKLLVYSFKYIKVKIQAILKDSLDDLFCIFDVLSALPLNYRALFCRKINVKNSKIRALVNSLDPNLKYIFKYSFCLP